MHIGSNLLLELARASIGSSAAGDKRVPVLPAGQSRVGGRIGEQISVTAGEPPIAAVGSPAFSTLIVLVQVSRSYPSAR